MMKIAVIRAPFDPVCEKEVKAALDIQRSGFDLAVLIPDEEGVLPRRKRLELLRRALQPYRKAAAALQFDTEHVRNTVVFSLECADEEEALARTGRFDKAARGIRKILAEEGLYLEQIVDANCSPHRAAHSKSVAQVCRRLAHAHHLDEFQAWKAGMLHDLTKSWDDERGRKLLEVYDPGRLKLSPKVWHSYTAPVWLKQVMGIQDRQILQAIGHHTLGTGLGDLDMILYIADKTEPLRGYDSSYEIAVSEKNLKEGAALVLSESKKYLREKEGIDV